MPEHLPAETPESSTPESSTPEPAMPSVQTFVLSEALMQQLRPLAQEFADQEREARRMQMLAEIIQAHVRLLIAHEIGVDVSSETQMQLDMARGIVRIQS